MMDEHWKGDINFLGFPENGYSMAHMAKSL